MSRKRKTGKRIVGPQKEETQYELTYETESGFTLEITPLPPYYLDIIEDLYPFLEYPTREIVLHAGDIIQQPYTPPEEELEEDHEDYDIYQRWYDVDRHNKEVDTKRARAKRDLLMSVCIEILDGPDEVDDPMWITNLEGPFADVEFEVPEHPGRRKLMFLKYRVIRSSKEGSEIVQAAMYKEVSLQGISTALKGFQSEVGRNSNRESDSRKQTEDSS